MNDILPHMIHLIDEGSKCALDTTSYSAALAFIGVTSGQMTVESALDFIKHVATPHVFEQAKAVFTSCFGMGI